MRYLLITLLCLLSTNVFSQWEWGVTKNGIIAPKHAIDAMTKLPPVPGPVGGAKAVGTIIGGVISGCQAALYLSERDLCREAAAATANYVRDMELGKRYGDFKPGYDWNAVKQLENLAKQEKNESQTNLDNSTKNINEIIESNKSCKEKSDDFADLDNYKDFQEKINKKYPISTGGTGGGTPGEEKCTKEVYNEELEDYETIEVECCYIDVYDEETGEFIRKDKVPCAN